jgi:hypothetical protein
VGRGGQRFDVKRGVESGGVEGGFVSHDFLLLFSKMIARVRETL